MVGGEKSENYSGEQAGTDMSADGGPFENPISSRSSCMSCCWERDNGFCPSSRRPCLQADWPNCKAGGNGGREGWEGGMGDSDRPPPNPRRPREAHVEMCRNSILNPTSTHIYTLNWMLATLCH